MGLVYKTQEDKCVVGGHVGTGVVVWGVSGSACMCRGAYHGKSFFFFSFFFTEHYPTYVIAFLDK